jgi:hypothetical protein
MWEQKTKETKDKFKTHLQSYILLFFKRKKITKIK